MYLHPVNCFNIWFGRFGRRGIGDVANWCASCAVELAANQTVGWKWKQQEPSIVEESASQTARLYHVLIPWSPGAYRTAASTDDLP